MCCSPPQSSLCLLTGPVPLTPKRVCLVRARSLFAPLTGLEVQSRRVEDSVLVVSVGVSINLASLTIEQVIGRRKKLVEDMADNIVTEVKGVLNKRRVRAQPRM